MIAPDQGCFAAPGRRISVAEALELLRGSARTMVATETIPLREAPGRCLAASVTAPRDVPAFDNAAVDGYAFAFGAGLGEGAELALVEGRAAAGHAFLGNVPSGGCLRVLTGAPMPRGTDTVALQEAVRVVGERVRLPEGLRAGANCRRMGEDIRAATSVLDAGRRLSPAEIGVIAELGLSRVEVFRPLRVALLSSGDELIDPGASMRSGGVYDANRHILAALMASLPVELEDVGIMPDDPVAVRTRLADVATRSHIILTSGGASRGDEDHVVRSAQQLGRLDFWQIAMKPGRPLAFGQIGHSLFIGLPGNPVAAMVCYLLFAKPLLLRAGGATWVEPRRHPVRAGSAMSKHPGRTELVRARLEADDRGGWIARPIARQGSGVLTTMLEADGLIELASEATNIVEGQTVPFLTFAELLAA